MNTANLNTLTEEERQKLAVNRNTSNETLTKLASDANKDVRRVIACNPNTSPETLNQLATDPNEDVRGNVAANPNTPPKALTQLAGDPNEEVRRDVAANPNTPPATLTQLATDEDETVRAYVGPNPATPTEALILLITDPDEEVQAWAAGNPNIANELLWTLLTHPQEDVPQLANHYLTKQNLSTTNANWTNTETLTQIYTTLTKNNQLNEPILTQLLKAQLPLTQQELIELCELHNTDIHNVINQHYTITHPLLQQILSPKQTHIQYPPPVTQTKEQNDKRTNRTI